MVHCYVELAHTIDGSGGSLFCLLLYMDDLNEEWVGKVRATSERSNCVVSSTSASLYRVGTGVTSSLALFLSLLFISSTQVVVGLTAWLCPFCLLQYICTKCSDPSST